MLTEVIFLLKRQLLKDWVKFASCNERLAFNPVDWTNINHQVCLTEILANFDSRGFLILTQVSDKTIFLKFQMKFLNLL